MSQTRKPLEPVGDGLDASVRRVIQSRPRPEVISYDIKIVCDCGMELTLKTDWVDYPRDQEYHCGTCQRVYTFSTKEKSK